MDMPTPNLDRPVRRRSGWLPIAVVLLAVALMAVGIYLAMRGEKRARPPAIEPASTLPAGPPPSAESYQPLDIKPIAPEEAVAINAAVPIDDRPVTAATAFTLKPEAGLAYDRALDCLTAAVYYEAASEAPDGQRAVAQVVLNRMRHPAYPASVCGVVFEGWERATGCQFTFTCDGAIFRLPSEAGWARARKIAAAALAGSVYKPVGWSTHYHTNWVVPNWAASLSKTAIVGTHIFYRWQGGWGERRSFGKRYAGAEPAQSLLALRFPSHQPEEAGLPVIDVPPIAELATDAPPPPSETKRPLAADRAVTPLAADKEVGTLLIDRGTRLSIVRERRAAVGDQPSSAAPGCGNRLGGPAAPVKPSSADANLAAAGKSGC